jgi:light-harvesting complex I chlorophyll a/b binding protein 3
MATIASRALAPAASFQALRSSFATGTAIRVSTPSAAPVRSNGLVVRASDKPVVSSRQTWFSSPQSLSYLDGTLPGDFGFDPLGLSDPEGAGNFVEPKWLAYAEIINGRWAMLGAAGMFAPEFLGKLGVIPASTGLVWFQSGVIPPLGAYNYWADPYALFVLEIVLLGFAEHRRAQDYYKPGYGSKTPLLGLEKVLGGSGDPAYPGGPFFNFAGFGKDPKALSVLKLKEIKNGRLAMLACLGYFIQGIFTGVGPVQNLFDHLSNPIANNVLTNLKIH